MNQCQKRWNIIRLLRLAFGIFIVIRGILAGEWLLALAGVVLSLMPLLNIGCCSTSGCRMPDHNRNQL
ncbi:hypothetical protein [Sediminibacterium ginsengisoli]|uniref:DUF2892 domain-containing protein n=1 Tax=Sediminibacterium ginsengisoli TaxID=413434 RepID=A0A1T4KU12_9BACT|nr:hypothetical protein [Sediminibacterium ginsengisoli]SJZ45934.1 hypothetical protein SAMN04488132_102116 [Sediminibacterium ginsengisoli]